MERFLHSLLGIVPFLFWFTLCAGFSLFLHQSFWDFAIDCNSDLRFFAYHFARSPAMETALLISPLLILGSLIYWQNRSSNGFLTAKSLSRYLFKDFLSYRIGLFLVCISVIFLAIQSLPITGKMALRYTILNAAQVLDRMGFYEIGEFIQSFQRSEDGCCLATSTGFIGHGSDRREIDSGRLNNTVARIYGPRSIQMARRYQSLAAHLFINFEDYKNEIENYIKAIDIYLSLGKPFEAARCMAFASYGLFANGEIERAKDMVHRGLELPLSATERSQIADLMYPTAFSLKNSRLLAHLKSLSISKAGVLSRSEHLLLTTEDLVTYYGSILAMVLGGMFFIHHGKRHYLNRARRHWLAQLHISEAQIDNLPSTIALYERLIAWHIFKRQYREADQYSRAMLQAAELN